jgi:hypothetical protein
MRSTKRIRALLLAAAVAVPASLPAQSADPLLVNFRAPPAEARPFVFWNWLNGNVTEDGIRRDLAWMKRAGIGGMLAFEAELNVRDVVDETVRYRSPKWEKMVRTAISEANLNSLDLVVLAAPGWSESGGPWVKPQQAMKKLVWSETRLAGGSEFDGQLAAVPRLAGPFQDAPRSETISLSGNAPQQASLDLYSDVAVLAFPQPAEDLPLPGAVLTSNAGTFDAASLTDGSFATTQTVDMPDDASPAWFQYSFPQPVTLRALTVGIGSSGVLSATMPSGTIEASDDGRTFRPVGSVSGNFSQYGGSFPAATFAFTATRARYWRVTVSSTPPRSISSSPPFSRLELTELAFHAGARVHRFEAKAGFMVAEDYTSLAGAEPSAAVSAESILDLTDLLRTDGTLDWSPPEGNWIVLRFGYSLTGATNHPASAEGTGLEVDKLNAVHVRSHIEQMMAPFLAARLPGPHGLRAIETDSWEVGQGNWTEAMSEEFGQRRGYAMRRWLPVVAGYVVDSAKDSDRFLWDLRRTVADLLADKHYSTLADYAHANGLEYYAEAMGVGTPTIGDALANKRRADVPMGEFWQTRPDEASNPTHVGDILEAASAAHVSGTNLVGAEAFTAWPAQPPFTATPWLLKPLADRFLAHGVNRFIIHTSAHQPTEDAPGVTLGPFGQFFTRHETWAEMASGWTDYLARASYLLQQGRFAADAAYFYGEGAAGSVGDATRLDPALTQRHAVDFIDRETLLTLLDVQDGQLTTPSGMRYRLLVLPANTTRMSLAAISRIRDLVTKGAVVLGPRPEGASSLGDDDEAVRAIAREVWGSAAGVHRLGQGRVHWDGSIDDTLAAEGVTPSFAYDGDAKLVSINRTLGPGGEMWFVANQGNTPADVVGRFRVTGREAEYWYPAEGTTAPASFALAGGVTEVPLRLAPYESVFVVFRQPAAATGGRVVPLAEERLVLPVAGSWQVSFQPGRGAPASTRMAVLVPLSSSADPGIRYFSGTATYSTHFDLKARPAGKLMLELGRVGEVARVRLNGCEAGIAWKPPYRVHVGCCARKGRNLLEVDVANLWTNRLIGDAQPGATPVAKTTLPFAKPGSAGGFNAPAYTTDSALTPSGLIGPVRLVALEGGPE